MHPVAQRLPVHGSDRGRCRAAHPVAHRRHRLPESPLSSRGTTADLRLLAKQAEDACQARRLLSPR
jgi:hypothetical protein